MTGVGPQPCPVCGRPLGATWPHHPHDPDCVSFAMPDPDWDYIPCTCPTPAVHPDCCQDPRCPA